MNKKLLHTTFGLAALCAVSFAYRAGHFAGFYEGWDRGNEDGLHAGIEIGTVSTGMVLKDCVIEFPTRESTRCSTLRRLLTEIGNTNIKPDLSLR